MHSTKICTKSMVYQFVPHFNGIFPVLVEAYYFMVVIVTVYYFMVVILTVPQNPHLQGLTGALKSDDL